MRYSSKPYSEACEQNKGPILAVLCEVFTQPGTVLEIGSGTGQHAVHLARHLPHLDWQPTDLLPCLPGIRLWLEEAALRNVRPPLALDVSYRPWPLERTDYVFSANTTHIMSWRAVQSMFQGIAEVLVPGGFFCLYGPFNYGGRYTSHSNAQFDAWLRMSDPSSGIRDVEDLGALARETELDLVQDIPMPANNRTLVWRQGPHGVPDDPGAAR